MLEQYSHIRHWLVVRLSHLGDVALTTGVLAYWGERYDLRFSVLTKQEWTPIFQNHLFVTATHGLSADDLPLPKLLSNFVRLRKEYPDSGLLDFHGTMRSFLLRGLWKNATAAYPKLRKERKQFLSGTLSDTSTQLLSLTVPQRYSLALEEEAPAPALLKPRLWLTEDEQTFATKALSAQFGSQAPVALHPFATHIRKTWSRGKWLQLAALLDEQGIPWIAIGKGDALFPGNPRDFTNKTNLRETAALLSGARALITGDSGPMHLATAVDTPIVGLFGPTTVQWGFYPYGENNVILEQDLSCRPCSLHGNPKQTCDGACLETIPASRVLETLEQITATSEIPARFQP